MKAAVPIVYIVDDDASVRSSTERMLRGAGYEVETYGSIHDLALARRPATPCCLILDVRMPDANGLEFQQTLGRASIRVPIIFITGFDDLPTGVHAMKAGAVDFFTKPFDVDKLLEAVRAALSKDAALLGRERDLQDLQRRYETLTGRERDVFFAVTAGLPNKLVAARFGIAEKTVKVHRGHVTEKMEADSFAELVRMADTVRSSSDAADRHSLTEADLSCLPC